MRLKGRRGYQEEHSHDSDNRAPHEHPPPVHTAPLPTWNRTGRFWIVVRRFAGLPN